MLICWVHDRWFFDACFGEQNLYCSLIGPKYSSIKYRANGFFAQIGHGEFSQESVSKVFFNFSPKKCRKDQKCSRWPITSSMRLLYDAHKNDYWQSEGKITACEWDVASALACYWRKAMVDSHWPPTWRMTQQEISKFRVKLGKPHRSSTLWSPPFGIQIGFLRTPNSFSTVWCKKISNHESLRTVVEPFKTFPKGSRQQLTGAEISSYGHERRLGNPFWKSKS